MTDRITLYKQQISSLEAGNPRESTQNTEILIVYVNY